MDERVREESNEEKILLVPITLPPALPILLPSLPQHPNLVGTSVSLDCGDLPSPWVLKSNPVISSSIIKKGGDISEQQDCSPGNMDSVFSFLLLLQLLSLAGQEFEKGSGRSQRDELAAAVIPESSQGIFHGLSSEGQIWPGWRQRHLLGTAYSLLNMSLTQLTTSSLSGG